MQAVSKSNTSLASGFPLGLLFLIIANSIGLTQGREVEIASCDLSAAIFLAIGFVYRGSGIGWWGFFLPAGVFFMFLPIAHWESMHLLGFGGLLRAGLAPFFSVLAACLLASFRLSRQEVGIARGEIERVIVKSRELISRVRGLETEMKIMIRAQTKNQTEIVGTSLPFMQTIEFHLSPPPVESAALEHREVTAILTDAMERVRRFSSARGQTGFRMMLTSPTETSLPMAVRGTAPDLNELLSLIFEQATSSLGPGNEGVVRASMRPTLSSLSILIEDNGRGFSEAILERTAPAQSARWSKVRALAERSGWILSRQARLGVGARVSLELPRVDAFASTPSTRTNLVPSVRPASLEHGHP